MVIGRMVIVLLILFLFHMPSFASNSAGSKHEMKQVRSLNTQLEMVHRDMRLFLDRVSKDGCSPDDLEKQKRGWLQRVRIMERKANSLPEIQKEGLRIKIHALRSKIRSLDKNVNNIALKKEAIAGKRTRSLKKTNVGAGAITGTVTDAVTTTPLANIEIDLYDSNGDLFSYAYTNTSGVYVIAAIPDGTYYARTFNWGNYIDELYDNIPCEPDCDPLTGTPISLSGNAQVDFALATGGSISGSITDAANGNSIDGGVNVYDASGNFVTSGWTDESGSYLVNGLPGGNYFLVTENWSAYLDELFDNIPCYNGNCDPLTGTPVSVVQGSVTSGINFALDRGGKIRGSINDELTGLPLSSVSVTIYDSAGDFAGFAYSYDGRYLVEGLGPGNYFAVTYNYDGYLDELYNNIPCFGGNCNPVTGTPIPVQIGGETVANFELLPGGRISGRITDSQTSDPIPYVGVNIMDSDGNYVSYAYTDTNGDYISYGGLPTGQYYAQTYNYSGYINELYDNIPCPPGYCDPLTGTPIAVTAGSTTTGIDFALDPGGKIQGTVVSSNGGTPLTNFSVRAFDSGGTLFGIGYSQGGGSYSIGGLPTGNYRVVTWNYDLHIDELYDNVVCPFGNCDLSAGTPVSVTLSQTTSNINFVLDPGGTISGTVTQAGSGNPIQYVDISIFDSAGNSVGYGYSDSSGAYSMTWGPGLVTGNYYARSYNSYGYVDELYNDILCPGWCDPTTGTPIPVTTGSNTSGIDFALQEGGSISGKVTRAGTGTPIRYMTLLIYDSSGNFSGSTYTDAFGNYTTNLPLVTGNYHVTTYSYGDYADELYDNIPCPGGYCDPTTGTPVPVTIGSNTPGIDFELKACPTIRITPSILPDGQVSTVYNTDINVSGATPPYVFTLKWGSLPEGLSLDPATGVISGTPQLEGIYDFGVLVIDSSGCAASRFYSIDISPAPCLFCDEFNDGNLTGWEWNKGTWEETGGNLIGTHDRKARITEAGSWVGCEQCNVETSMQTSGGIGTRVSLIGWFIDKSNYVEVLMKEAENRWVIKQRSEGVVVRKESAPVTIDPNTFYNVKVSFDGTNFHVSIDGSEVIDMLAAVPPGSGTVGFQIKATTGTFEWIRVN